MLKRKFGWIPQLPDLRDRKYSIAPPVALPKAVDLRPLMPPIYDQGALGSCTANAIAAAFQYDHIRQGLEDFIPSRLFIYFNERTIENTVRSDSGAMIRDGIKSISSQGVCPETIWPYITDRFDIMPSAACYQTAKEHQALIYEAVPLDLNSIKACLALGDPVIFGFTVYQSFESLEVQESGIVPMPSAFERVVGGHAVLAVGYSDDLQELIVRNSWGTDWGKEGYFFMPYAYMESELASDFWTIKSVD